MWRRQIVFLLASTLFVGLLFYVMPTDHRVGAAAVPPREPPTRKTIPSAEWGEKLFTKNACPICHGVGGSGLIDGAKSPGPKLAGIHGTTRLMTTGESIRADESYLRESIVQPRARVVAGSSSVQMPAFVMKDAQVDAIVAYLESSK